MDFKDVELLMPARLLDYAVAQLTDGFTLHDLSTATDKDGFINSVAGNVRGMASTHYNIDGQFMDRFPKLEIIANFGVGYDNIDAVAAHERGIIVTNTPDVLTEEVADTALGLLIAAVRELPQSERYLRDGKWISDGAYPLTQGTLRGKKLGVAGFGRIGKAIAHRAEAFGLEISYYGRSKQDRPEPYYSDLREMAANVDIIVSVLPGGSATEKIFNGDVFEALGSQGYFVNIGRGSTVDEPALIAALKSGQIAGAGLDVFDDEPNVPAEFLTLQNAVLLPHVGSGSIHTRNEMGQLVVDNLTSWFSSNGPITPVPETPFTKS